MSGNQVTTVFQKTMYAQTADPGAVGAGKIWVDTDDNCRLYVRDSSNAAWTEVTAGAGGGGGSDNTSYIPTATTLAAYQAAIDSAGTNGNVRFHSKTTITISSPLEINSNNAAQTQKNDGIEINGQGVKFQAHTSSWSGTAMMLINLFGADTTATKLTIRNINFDPRGQSCHGLANIGSEGFDAGENWKLKYILIHDITFASGSNVAGKHYIYLRNTENMVEINHCELESVVSTTANPSYGIFLENDGHNGGNCVVSFCKVSLNGSGQAGICIYVYAKTSPFNRMFIVGNHLFCNNSMTDAVGVKIQADNTGAGADSNRTHVIMMNGIEDFFNEVWITTGGSTSSNSLSVWVIGNGLENKNDGDPGTYEAGNEVIRIGAYCTVHIHSNYLMWQGSSSAGSGQVFTTITIDANANGDECSMVGNWFHKKVGHSDITWTKLGGDATQVAALAENSVHNIGFKTEGAWVSADVAVDSAGEKTFTITHDMDVTPAIKNIVLTLANGTTALATDDAMRATLPLYLVSVSSTTITAKLRVTTASGTAGADLVCIAHCRRNF